MRQLPGTPLAPSGWCICACCHLLCFAAFWQEVGEFLEVLMSFAEAQSDDLNWHSAAACGSGACVEVAYVGDEVLVRDGKDPSGPVLRYSLGEWVAFAEGVRLGEFEPPASA